MFRTLLVDDNDAFRRTLRGLLARHFPFMEIDEAATGEAALRLDCGYRLVFMDIHLPDVSGLEVTRRITSACPESLVCILTQHDLPEYREAAGQSGARAFLVKEDASEAAIVELVQAAMAPPRA